MSHVRPFRGIRYDLSKTGGDPSMIFCPPDDLLTASRRRTLLQRSPWNFLRVRLGVETAEQDPNTSQARSHAAVIGREWLRDGVMVRDFAPSFYVYRQTFTATVGGVDDRFSRTGLVASLDPEAIIGIPQPGTGAGIAGAGWETSLPVFLHSEPLESFRELLETAKPPVLRFLDDQSVDHAFQVIDDSETVRSLQGILRNLRGLFLEGQIPSGPGPHLAMLVAGDDPGLVLQPVHRIYRDISPAALATALEGLRTSFKMEELPYLGVDAAEALLATLPENVHGFALRLKDSDSIWLLEVSEKSPEALVLDSTILGETVDKALFGDALRSEHRNVWVADGHRAMDLLDSDTASSLAILVRPVGIRTLFARAEAHNPVDISMVPLHPSPWSGLVSQIPDA